VVTITVTKPSPPVAAPYPQPPFQPVSSFQQKLITTTITLAPNAAVSGQSTSFPETSSNTVALSGYRTRARISNGGGAATATATIDIFGLPQSLINSLVQAGPVFNFLNNNTVLISAGTAQSGLTPVFGGTIWYSYGLFSNQPDVPLRIVAIPGGNLQVTGIPPSSFAGATDVATIMAGLARAAGVQFENNGVTAQLQNPYYAGNLDTQVRRIAHDAHINAEWVDANSKLAIWPIGGSRTSTTTVPLISPATGMIGYPAFQSNGYVVVKHLFNPQVSFGGNIEVQSSVRQVNGQQWTVWRLDYELDSLVPHGEWAATAYCYKVGTTPPAPPSG
jgi:hypothetical protein